MPRAYNAKIFSSKPSSRVCPFLTSCGAYRAVPITWRLDVHMPLLAFERFLTMPIALIAGDIALASMFGVAQVTVQFCFQAALKHRFGQFFKEAPFAQDHTWPELSSHLLALGPGGPLRLSGQAEMAYHAERNIML